MRLLVCGGRNYAKWCSGRNPEARKKFLKEQDFVWLTLNGIYEECVDHLVVISGGATGADSSAADWAESRYIDCEIYHADWESWGPRAGPMRNQQMLDEGKPTHVLAIKGGSGTADMVRRAKKAGIPVTEVK